MLAHVYNLIPKSGPLAGYNFWAAPIPVGILSMTGMSQRFEASFGMPMI